MTIKHLITIVTMILAAALAGATFLIPPLEDITNLQLAQTTAITVLVLGTVTLFLSALSDFRSQLRKAYVIICLATVLLCMSMAQYLFLALTHQFESWWITSYVYVAPLAVAAILFYVGARIIARAMGVQSWFLNPLVVLGLALIAAAAWGASPLVLPSPSLPKAYDGTLSADAFIATIWLAAALLIGKARSVMGTIYRRAFTWMFAWLVLGGGNVVLYSILQVMLPFGHWYYALNLYYLPDVIIGIVGIWTALKMSLLALAERSDQVYSKLFSQKTNMSSVDIVVCLAGFVSNPRAIEPILDEMREITAVRENAQSLSEKQQTILAGVLLKVESYLVNKEPIRKFNAVELQQMVELRFKDSVDEPAFWRRVASSKV